MDLDNGDFSSLLKRSRSRAQIKSSKIELRFTSQLHGRHGFPGQGQLFIWLLARIFEGTAAEATQQSTGAYGMVQRRPAVQIRRLNDGFGDAAADASFSADTTAVQGCGGSNLHRNGGGGDTTISRTMDSAMRRLMLRSRLIRRRFMAAAALIFTGTAAEATQQSAGACSVVGSG